jgi:hypothetical protein
MRIQVLYYILAISYCTYLFFQLRAVIMEDRRRILKLKSTEPMDGPPTKRPRLLRTRGHRKVEENAKAEEHWSSR